MFQILDAGFFAYYEVYLTVGTGRPVAWIFRVPVDEPYRYFVCYCDGVNMNAETRGSAHNAREYVRHLVSIYKPQ